jgi:hypothetical protein
MWPHLHPFVAEYSFPCAFEYGDPAQAGAIAFDDMDYIDTVRSVGIFAKLRWGRFGFPNLAVAPFI